MRIMGCNPEVAGGSDFEPAAEAPAGHARDHGSREGAHGLAEVAQAADEGFGGLLVKPGHLLDVGATDHALLALAAQHYIWDAVVGRELLQAFAISIVDLRAQN